MIIAFVILQTSRTFKTMLSARWFLFEAPFQAGCFHVVNQKGRALHEISRLSREGRSTTFSLVGNRPARSFQSKPKGGKTLIM